MSESHRPARGGPNRRADSRLPLTDDDPGSRARQLLLDERGMSAEDSDDVIAARRTCGAHGPAHERLTFEDDELLRMAEPGRAPRREHRAADAWTHSASARGSDSLVAPAWMGARRSRRGPPAVRVRTA